MGGNFSQQVGNDQWMLSFSQGGDCSVATSAPHYREAIWDYAVERETIKRKT
jgi:hypothetical protein